MASAPAAWLRALINWQAGDSVFTIMIPFYWHLHLHFSSNSKYGLTFLIKDSFDISNYWQFEM
jgi:hypothetical protein